MGRLSSFSVHLQKWGSGWHWEKMFKVVKDGRWDSEPLEELLELPDELCVHGLHQDAEVLVPHQGLLRLQLLVHKLLERHTVHWVLKGQLQPGKQKGKVTATPLPPVRKS